jgi:hypothetical protein
MHDSLATRHQALAAPSSLTLRVFDASRSSRACAIPAFRFPLSAFAFRLSTLDSGLWTLDSRLAPRCAHRAVRTVAGTPGRCFWCAHRVSRTNTPFRTRSIEPQTDLQSKPTIDHSQHSTSSGQLVQLIVNPLGDCGLAKIVAA